MNVTDSPHRPGTPEHGVVHPCGIVGDHIDECLKCGKHRELGWAHLCRPCWDQETA